MFKSNLRLIREMRLMSRHELSVLARVSPAWIYKLESAEVKDTRLSTILRLSQVLECRPEDIFPVLSPPTE